MEEREKFRRFMEWWISNFEDLSTIASWLLAQRAFFGAIDSVENYSVEIYESGVKNPESTIKSHYSTVGKAHTL